MDPNKVTITATIESAPKAEPAKVQLMYTKFMATDYDAIAKLLSLASELGPVFVTPADPNELIIYHMPLQ